MKLWLTVIISKVYFLCCIVIEFLKISCWYCDNFSSIVHVLTADFTVVCIAMQLAYKLTTCN